MYLLQRVGCFLSCWEYGLRVGGGQVFYFRSSVFLLEGEHLQTAPGSLKRWLCALPALEGKPGEWISSKVRASWTEDHKLVDHVTPACHRLLETQSSPKQMPRFGADQRDGLEERTSGQECLDFLRHTHKHAWLPSLSDRSECQASHLRMPLAKPGKKLLAAGASLQIPFGFKLTIWHWVSGPVCLCVSLCVCMKVLCPRIGGTIRKNHRPSSPTCSQSLEQEPRCPLSTYWQKVSEPGVRRSCLKWEADFTLGKVRLRTQLFSCHARAQLLGGLTGITKAAFTVFPASS